MRKDVEGNKTHVVAFYELMFNACRPRVGVQEREFDVLSADRASPRSKGAVAHRPAVFPL
jgi:hypothetical protein